MIDILLYLLNNIFHHQCVISVLYLLTCSVETMAEIEQYISHQRHFKPFILKYNIR